jgi:hypothetical protein
LSEFFVRKGDSQNRHQRRLALVAPALPAEVRHRQQLVANLEGKRNSGIGVNVVIIFPEMLTNFGANVVITFFGVKAVISVKITYFSPTFYAKILQKS